MPSVLVKNTSRAWSISSCSGLKIRDFSSSSSAFNEYAPRSREREHSPIYVEERRVKRELAVQPYATPKKVGRGRGPFPQEVLQESQIVTEYVSEINEDGSEFIPGSTAQNNYMPPKWLRCGTCMVRVKETEKEGHVCV